MRGPPASCADMFNSLNGDVSNGYYSVFPAGDQVRVWCDMVNGGKTYYILDIGEVQQPINSAEDIIAQERTAWAAAPIRGAKDSDDGAKKKSDGKVHPADDMSA